MKVSKRSLSVVFSIAFIVLAVPLVTSIYQLQERMKAFDNGATNGTFYTIYGLMIAEIALSILSIVLLIKSKESEFDLQFDDSINMENEEDSNTTVGKEKISKKAGVVLEKLRNSLNEKMTADQKAEKVLSVLSQELEICQAIFYQSKEKKNEFNFSAGYALHKADKEKLNVVLGEGLVGQVAKNQKLIVLNSVPDGYMTVISGLGETHPTHLTILPIVINKQTIGVIELASFNEFEKPQLRILENVADELSKHFQLKPSTTSKTSGKNETSEGNQEKKS